MTFLAPAFLFASFAVAAVIVGLHFIVNRQPRSSILPTARFVPDTPATTIAPARRPSDLLVMLLRVLTVLAAGAALAKPVLHTSRRSEARVVLVDVSRSVRDTSAIRDSARAYLRDGDALVIFDAAARVSAGNVEDTLTNLPLSQARGNLSAGLIAALRAGSTLRDRADSLQLVIVSPLAKEELDAATESIRKLWPGNARLIRLASVVADTAHSASAGRLDLSADDDDPLAITIGLARSAARSTAFVDRAPFRSAPSPNSTASQSSPASAGGGASQSRPVTVGGGALIDWPASSRPLGSVNRSPIDTVGGVTSGDAGVIAPFERRWLFPPDSLRGAEVIARWMDGEPAAVEKPVDAGCLRSVAVPVATVGDLAIRADFVRFVKVVSRACARTTARVPAGADDIARLTGTGGLAPREAFQSPTNTRSALAPWLLALAIITAIGELLVRRHLRATAKAGQSAASSGEARAA